MNLAWPAEGVTITLQLDKSRGVYVATFAGLAMSPVERESLRTLLLAVAAVLPAAPRGRGRPRLACPPALVEKLGRVPDAVLAREADVAPATVARWRTGRGISRIRRQGRGRPRFPVPPAIEALLGTLPDLDIARMANVSATTTRKWRIAAGKPPAPEIRPPWGERAPSRLAAVRDRLGTTSDAELAREAGVSRALIHQWRTRLGIPAHASAQPLANRHNWDSVADLLGTVPDRIVAIKLGCHVYTVAMHRENHGIVATMPAVGIGSRGLRVLVYRDMLGKIPDTQVAKVAGVSGPHVTRVRQALGIPPAPWNTRHRKKEPR